MIGSTSTRQRVGLLGSLGFLFAVLPSMIAGCTTGGESVDEGAAFQTEGPDGYAPYPTEIREGLVRLDGFDPQNVSVADFASEARNQGRIASCASFGFIGLLENQLANERGITTDFSERFMIFSNFLQTGTLGGDPKVMARFGELTGNIGLMPESAYPYSAVEANASRFEQDAAQGLTTDHSLPPLSKVIEGTENMTKARSDILQRPEFIGSLPEGPYPVTIPLAATLAPDAKVPEVEFEGKIYSCFSSNPAAVPAEKRLALTPRELVAMCLDVQPERYFTCGLDTDALEAQMATAVTATEPCATAAQQIEFLAKPWTDANVKALRLTLALLDQGDAVEVGMRAPGNGLNMLPVWSSKTAVPGGGHAVLATGYITGEELESSAEQERGLLASGEFDRMAALVDPAYGEKIAAGLPADPIARRDLRVSSALGRAAIADGGLVFIRNSWGTTSDGAPVGIDGTQAMTFEFFARAGMLVLGKKAPRAMGISWNDMDANGCPRTMNIRQASAWAARDHVTGAKEYLRMLLGATECPAR